MNAITRLALSPLKHILGAGYGECFCCGFHWNMVEPHFINITGDRGCFATCRDCWENKSNLEIIDAYNKLYDSWVYGNKYNRPHTEKEIGYTRAKMLSSLRKALKERKK